MREYSILCDERVQYSECCEKLKNADQEDLKCNLFTELQQFYSHIRHKFCAIKSGNTRFSHAELHKVMVKDNIECAFPNVEIPWHIFSTLIASNHTAECSFSQLKHKKSE